MNDQENKESFIERERRMLPFFVEFVKFSIGFVVILITALFALRVVAAG